MKKILGISLVAMMAVTTAHANIASEAWVTSQTGALNSLTTTNKDNLVGAINEVKTAVSGVNSDLSSYELKSNVTSKGSATNPVYFDENGVATAITSYPYANLTGTPTVDAAPTENSTNAVQSGGVYTALAGKQDTIAAGTYVDTVTTSGSGNVVTAVSTNTNGTVTATMGNAIMETATIGSDGTYVLTANVSNGAVSGYKWELITRPAAAPAQGD